MNQKKTNQKERKRAMRYNIIATGSGGNCALATFSDEKRYYLTSEKAVLKNAQKRD